MVRDFFFFLAHSCTVSCQEMSFYGCCSFWLSRTSDSDSCQCLFLQSDIIKGFTSRRLASFAVKSCSVPSSESYSILSVSGVFCARILFKSRGVWNRRSPTRLDKFSLFLTLREGDLAKGSAFLLQQSVPVLQEENFRVSDCQNKKKKCRLNDIINN